MVACISAHAAGSAETTTENPETSRAFYNWPMYNQTYDGQRFSSLSKIDVGNVHQLREVCRARIDQDGGFHASPIVVDGVIYVATARTTVAVDATNCDIIWKRPYIPEQQEVFGTIRGVAFADGRVFRGTNDGRLLAFDFRTGQQLWKTIVGDPSAGEYASSAPLVHKDRVYIGLAGGDYGIVGRMMAFDASTGRRIWSFNLVPQGREFGADTWPGDTNKLGGGGTWSGYTFDPATEELFIPVGNPAPDFHGDHRLGSNLFTNSLVVLDARSGRLRWWYQLTPNDDRDWDYVAPPVLLKSRDGHPLVALGHKDGYVHVVSRVTHKLVYKTAITTIENEGARVTTEGIKSCPGLGGGVQWYGPAYDIPNHSLVVGSVDWCSIIKKEDLRYERGQLYYGGSFTWVNDPAPNGWITSIDADAGTVRWRFRTPAPVVSGVTATAGGLVFAGDLSGQFYAFRASDGQILFRTDTRGAMAGGISTYAVDDRQYVAVTSGNISRMIWGAVGTPSLVIYGLPDQPGPRIGPSPGSGVPMPKFSTPNVLSGPAPDGDAGRGKNVYARVCGACHGSRGEGGTGLPLKGIGSRMSMAEIISAIRDPKGAMPRLYPEPLDDKAVADVAEYVRTLE